MEKIRNFRDLNIWKLGMEIVEDVYRLTKEFPREELYGLSAQMRRCAVSIPSNTAEGFTRKHNKEYKQFLYISLGSCAELETQIEIAFRLKYLNEQAKEVLLEKTNHVTRMTMNLLKCL
jgi:four helix bundle protein